MQIGNLKYILISAFVGVLLWVVLVELVYYSRSEIYILLDPSYWLTYYRGYSTYALIAIIIGTYMGLWNIGKIRKPSFLYGILSGLLSSVLFLSWTILRGAAFLFVSAGLVIGSAIVAGIIGVAIIRRISPSFCPNCGNKLPLGREPCSKCGTNP